MDTNKQGVIEQAQTSNTTPLEVKDKKETLRQIMPDINNTHDKKYPKTQLCERMHAWKEIYSIHLQAYNIYRLAYYHTKLDFFKGKSLKSSKNHDLVTACTCCSATLLLKLPASFAAKLMQVQN